MKILFYGDSNTYGYDPADLYNLRYPTQRRWTTLLQQQVPEDWEIIAEGMNGRQLPNLKYDAERINRMLDTLQPDDLFAVMLGTNDILLTMTPDADYAVAKMRIFLEYLTKQKAESDILVVAPPHIGSRSIRNPLYHRYYAESSRMNAGFRELTELYHVNFVDAGTWNLDMSADLVHLSEKGHRQFADRMKDYFEEAFPVKWNSWRKNRKGK